MWQRQSGWNCLVAICFFQPIHIIISEGLIWLLCPSQHCLLSWFWCLVGFGLNIHSWHCLRSPTKLHNHTYLLHCIHPSYKQLQSQCQSESTSLQLYPMPPHHRNPIYYFISIQTKDQGINSEYSIVLGWISIRGFAIQTNMNQQKKKPNNAPPYNKYIPISIFQGAIPGHTNQRILADDVLSLLIIACFLEADSFSLYLQQGWFKLLARHHMPDLWREMKHCSWCLSRQPTMVMRCLFFGKR